MASDMNSPARRGDEARIAEQAAEWLSELSESDEKRAAFFEWLRASPRHVEETLFVLALWKEAALLDKDRSEALMAEIGAHGEVAHAGVNVLPLPVADSAASRVLEAIPEHRTRSLSASVPGPVPTPRARRSGQRLTRIAGIAASLAVVVAAAAWLASTMLPRQEYATKVGEQRTFELEDGSLVQLNTRSRLNVHFSAHARELRLVEGEALFKVARDSSRPFRVLTADAEIQALGTQFNVYYRSDDTQVSVLEGLVQVSSARLPAGEQVNVTKGQVTHRAPLDVIKVTAWRQRRLVFHDDTLEDIAAEFNRYNRRVAIRVEAGAQAQRFTGTFDADAPDTFVLALGANKEVSVERGDNEIVIRARS